MRRPDAAKTPGGSHRHQRGTVALLDPQNRSLQQFAVGLVPGHTSDPPDVAHRRAWCQTGRRGFDKRKNQRHGRSREQELAASVARIARPQGQHRPPGPLALLQQASRYEFQIKNLTNPSKSVPWVTCAAASNTGTMSCVKDKETTVPCRPRSYRLSVARGCYRPGKGPYQRFLGEHYEQIGNT
jgi:hypothetical protein